jgi:hypothetical protein
MGKIMMRIRDLEMLCAREFTIPNTAGSSPNLACIFTDSRSSQPNQARCTPNFSYQLVSSTSVSSSSPISLFLIHNSSIIAENQVKSSLSVFPCHDHELIPSAVSTEYNMYHAHHSRSATFTEYRQCQKLFVFPSCS